MARFPVLSLLLWSAVSCGDRTGRLADAGIAVTDLPPTGGTVAFGDADCGTTPAPQMLMFHNTGTAPLTWSAMIQGDGFAITDGASGKISPGDTAAIAIAPATVPATAVVGQPITATLVVATNASDQAISVQLSVTPHGGSLHATTATVGFGQAQLTESLSQELEISNTGDRAIDLALDQPSNLEFAATWTGAPAAAPLDPTESLLGATARFHPTVAGMVTSQIGLHATGPVCAGDTAVTVAGEGTTAQVSVTPGTVQFGTTACGTTAAAKQVAIKNNYRFPIHYTAAITSGPYAIAAGQETGTVAASSTLNITVQASPVPSAAASLVANALAGAMTVTTDAPAATPASLTLAQAATGAVLALTPSPGQTIAFGDVANGTPVSKPYSVTNTGNAAAPVTVQTTGSGFSATAPGTVPTGGTATTSTVTETVVARGALTGTLAVSTTAPLCQATPPGPINLTATGRAAVAGIGNAPAMVATCGVTTPPAVNVAVQNTGDEPLVIAAATVTGGFVVTSALPLTLLPGTSGSIAIRPPAAVAGTDVAGTLKTGTLSFATNEIGAPIRSVALSSTVTGAALGLTPAPGSTIAFGNVNAGAPATQSYSVRNTGNLAAAVSVAVTGAGFTATTPGGGTIPANGTNQTASVTEAVGARGAVTGTLRVTSTTAQCTAPPGAINLTATGQAPTAVVGTAPAMVATCGVGTPAAVSVPISNTGDGALVVNATVTGGFVITSALPLTIAAGATSSITVRPPTAVVGTDAAGTVKTGTLSLTTNEIGAPARGVALSSTVTGAALALTPAPGSTIAFGNVDAGAPATQSYAVRNTGNLAAAVSVAVTGAGFTATTPGGGTIPANGTNQTASVTETVGARGAVTGTLRVTSSTAQCIAPPGAINLTATGQAPTAVVGTAPAMVATCGAGTPAAVNIPVNNTGDGALVVNATVTGGFAITSALPLTIAPGATSSITVRPPTAVVGTDAAGTVKTGTLSLTTNELGAPARSVALSSTVTGAALALTPAPGSTIAFGTVNAGTPATQTFSVRNTGNLAAAVSVAVTGTGFTATTPGGGTIPANGANQTANVTETVAARGAVTGTLTVTSSTAQCIAAPGGINLSATGRAPTAAIGTVPAMSAFCGAGAPVAVSVPISNTGDGPLVVNASVTGGFVITSALPITIAAGAASSIMVRPPTAVVGSDVGGSTRSGTLTLTTNEVTGASHQVALASTVRGANLTLTNAAGAPITTATFNATQMCPAPQTIFVRNSGNSPADISITTQNNLLFKFGSFSPSTTLQPGGGASHTLGVFTVNQACAGSETVQYTATGVLCTILPLSLNASFNIGGQSSCFCS